MDKPRTATGYLPEWVKHTRAACLYVATILGDLLSDHLIVVGGLVPSILVQQDTVDDGVPLHPGTMDLDLGLDLAILGDKRYSDIPNDFGRLALKPRKMQQETEYSKRGQ